MNIQVNFINAPSICQGQERPEHMPESGCRGYTFLLVHGTKDIVPVCWKRCLSRVLLQESLSIFFSKLLTDFKDDLHPALRLLRKNLDPVHLANFLVPWQSLKELQPILDLFHSSFPFGF